MAMSICSFCAVLGWEKKAVCPTLCCTTTATAPLWDVTRRTGLFSLHPTHAAAFADYDNDGWLDLFVGNESGKQPHPCQLFRNQGDGRFVDVAPAVGVDHVGFVKGVAWGDIDNDGLIDLYVSQFYRENVLYHNLGDTAAGWRFAAAVIAPGPNESFPTWFWDYDNDGWLDLFAGGYNMDDLGDMARTYLDEEFAADHAYVYRNNGDGTFTEVTESLGSFGQVILAMGANYGDLDNDGFPDCYVGTGIPDLRSLTPNRMLRNDGGARFLDVTTTGGFGNVQKGHGVSFADFDNDGDQDVFEVMGGAFEGDLYQNVLYENPGHGNHWLRLFPQGVQSNRGAIAAAYAYAFSDQMAAPATSTTSSAQAAALGPTRSRRISGWGTPWHWSSWKSLGRRPSRLSAGRNMTLDRAYRLREGHPSATQVVLPKFHFAAKHSGH